MHGQENEFDKYNELLSSDEYNFKTDDWWEELLSGASQQLGQGVRQLTDPDTAALAIGAGSMALLGGQAGPQMVLSEEILTVPGMWAQKPGRKSCRKLTIAGVQAGTKLDTGEWAYSFGDVTDRLWDTTKVSALTFTLTNVPSTVNNVTVQNHQRLVAAGEANILAGKMPTPEQLYAMNMSRADTLGKMAVLQMEELDDVDEMSQQQIEDNATTTAFNIDEIRPKLKTESNTAFFGSGNTDGVGGTKVAADIASRKNGVTLESLIDSKGIFMPVWDLSDQSSIKAWDMASVAYAEQVVGKVRAIVGAKLRLGNIWENVELPRLKANPNVTRIITIDPETGIETIIFER